MEEAIEREVLRDAMLESLRRQRPQQYRTFMGNTALVLKDRQLPTRPDVPSHMPTQLRPIDERRFREILWSLINAGILVQGMDASNDQWPWLSLTEQGEEYVSNRDADVYDPEGYLSDVARENPIDDVERRFLAQAIGAFRADLPDATAVMVGAACEHVIWKMAETIGSLDPEQAQKVAKLSTRPALEVLTYVTRYFTDRKKALPRGLREGLETTFSGVSSMIRAARNEAGHPMLRPTRRDDAFILLRLFVSQRNWAYDVMATLPLPTP